MDNDTDNTTTTKAAEAEPQGDPPQAEGGSQTDVDGPIFDDPALEAAFEAIWDEADEDERQAIMDGWAAARQFNERQRFLDAITKGKQALVQIEDDICEASGGRFGLYELMHEIEATTDPDALRKRLMVVVDSLTGSRCETILSLVAAADGCDARRACMARTVADYYEDLRWLLVDRPDPDWLPRSEPLRDLGIEACDLLANTITAIWEYLREIERALGIAQPAARTAELRRCPRCGRRVRPGAESKAK